MRKVFLENLKSTEDFKNNIGKKVEFVYDKYQGYFIISRIVKYDIYIFYKNVEFKTNISSLKNAQIGHIVHNIAAEQPWMIPFFEDNKIAFCTTFTSSKKVNMICPYCKAKKKNIISKLYKRHYLPCVCGDKMSYPEKFFYYLLKEMKENFVYQFSPEWATYEIDKKEVKAKYDFLIKNNLIVEMDGGFHFYDNRMNGTKLKTQQYIDAQKNEKAINNGYKIYRIDCLKSDFTYIKNNIIKTLGSVLYLDNIDWNNIYI